VHVFVQDSNGVACIQYQCTASEIIRAFALDVTVDRGQIVGISNFFRGQSVPGSTGYGIFPASFRDHITIGSGTNIDWSGSDYTPLAVVADNPSGTLPGLNSSGVTLEFGALWQANDPSAIPAPTGTLCLLALSQGAQVSIAPNVSRGGVVSAIAGSPIKTVFAGAPIGPAIVSASTTNGIMNLLFRGGELQTGVSAKGPWTDTGNNTGSYTESIETARIKFYRVKAAP
jgi:hypothetical protein